MADTSGITAATSWMQNLKPANEWAGTNPLQMLDTAQSIANKRLYNESMQQDLLEKQRDFTSRIQGMVTGAAYAWGTDEHMTYDKAQSVMNFQEQVTPFAKPVIEYLRSRLKPGMTDDQVRQEFRDFSMQGLTPTTQQSMNAPGYQYAQGPNGQMYVFQQAPWGNRAGASSVPSLAAQTQFPFVQWVPVPGQPGRTMPVLVMPSAAQGPNQPATPRGSTPAPGVPGVVNPDGTVPGPNNPAPRLTAQPPASPAAPNAASPPAAQPPATPAAQPPAAATPQAQPNQPTAQPPAAPTTAQPAAPAPVKPAPFKPAPLPAPPANPPASTSPPAATPAPQIIPETPAQPEPPKQPTGAYHANNLLMPNADQVVARAPAEPGQTQAGPLPSVQPPGQPPGQMAAPLAAGQLQPGEGFINRLLAAINPISSAQAAPNGLSYGQPPQIIQPAMPQPLPPGPGFRQGYPTPEYQRQLDANEGLLRQYGEFSQAFNGVKFPWEQQLATFKEGETVTGKHMEITRDAQDFARNLIKRLFGQDWPWTDTTGRYQAVQGLNDQLTAQVGGHNAALGQLSTMLIGPPRSDRGEFPTMDVLKTNLAILHSLNAAYTSWLNMSDGQKAAASGGTMLFANYLQDWNQHVDYRPFAMQYMNDEQKARLAEQVKGMSKQEFANYLKYKNLAEQERTAPIVMPGTRY